MERADKLSRRDPTKRRRRKDRSVSPEAAVPLASTVSPADEAAVPSRSRLRQLRWLFLLIPLVGIAVPAISWLQYRSDNVTSTNAAVRGQLAEIGTRVGGVVTSVEVDVGDRVREGQILVRLEDGHLRAQLQEAQADIGGLEREIEVEMMEIAHEGRRVEQQAQEAQARVEAAEAQERAAQIRVEDAQQVYELRERLFSRDGAVSSEEVRDAETQRRTAAAALEEAHANSSVARSEAQRVALVNDARTIRVRKVGVLQSELERAQARLTRAEVELEGTLVRAPRDGAIVRRIVEPGGSVDFGQPVISMWLGQDVWVEAWIDEDDISDVQLGSLATVTLHSFPGRQFPGTVDKIGLATDFEMPESDVPQPRHSRMRGAPVVGVRIRLEDSRPDLLPGLSAVVAIRKSE